MHANTNMHTHSTHPPAVHAHTYITHHTLHNTYSHVVCTYTCKSKQLYMHVYIQCTHVHYVHYTVHIFIMYTQYIAHTCYISMCICIQQYTQYIHGICVHAFIAHRYTNTSSTHIHSIHVHRDMCAQSTCLVHSYTNTYGMCMRIVIAHTQAHLVHTCTVYMYI